MFTNQIHYVSWLVAACFTCIACEAANPNRADAEPTAARQPAEGDNVIVEPEVDPVQDQRTESATGGIDPGERNAEQPGVETETVTPEPEPETIVEPPAAVIMPLSDAADVVEFVEVERYMGLWYEIATTPSFQQAACTGTTAEYDFDDANGWVNVTNTCYIGGLEGFPQGVQGRAELVDLDTQAKLNVIFFGQSAPYWVVALDGNQGDEPYDWAVVSVPGSQTMWLLSRTPQMSDDKRMAIEEHLEQRGFPVETLVDTLQGE
ncbi:MAG: lipocalin family protein [Myxococcota bacterium]|nr:lipocalin family protein [Myxococcota bacterium]